MASLAESLAAKVIALTIIVIVISSVAIPTIMDAQEQQVSTANNTSVRYISTLATDSGTYTVDLKSDGLYVNNSLITGIPLTATSYQVIFSDGFTSNYYGSTQSLRLTIFGQNAINLGVGDKLEFNTGVVSATISGVTSNVTTYDRVFLPDNSGKMGMAPVTTTDKVYLNADSVLYLVVSSSNINAAWTTGLAIISFNKDGIVSLSCTYVDPDDSEVKTFTDKTGIVLTLDSLAAVDDICWSFNGHVTLTTAVSTYSNQSYVYYPLEYSFISDEDSTYRVLIGLIPLLLIIVAVMFAVRMMGSKN